MPKQVISIKNLYKSFGDNEVISDLSFDVQEGEIFAFLGANGSGKTTTIRCLLDILKPNQGQALVFGKKYNNTTSYLLGYLPEERGLYTSSKVLETMIYFGTLKGLSVKKAKKFSLKYLDRTGLADHKDKRIKQLSSGQQQKIQLGITIINSPKLLILDEPTKGLDPVNRELLMEILNDLNKNGSTIIFITHQMDEVEKLANRLVMIKDGQRVLYGDVDKVRSKFGKNTIQLQYKGTLPENSKLYSAHADTNYAAISPNQDVKIEDILKYLISQNLKIQKFEVTAPSLQEIFIKISNGN